MGHGVNGGFARYVVLRPDQLYFVPKELSLEEAAISEPSRPLSRRSLN